MRQFAFLAAIILILSCNKKDSDTTKNNSPSVNGFWKGNTNTYGIGVVLRSDGTARSFWNYSSLALGDTLGATIVKSEGNYSKNGDSVVVNCNSGNKVFKLRGTINSAFSSMLGASSVGDATSIIVSQSYTITK